MQDSTKLILFCGIALLVGLVIGFLVGKRKAAPKKTTTKTATVVKEPTKVEPTTTNEEKEDASLIKAV